MLLLTLASFSLVSAVIHPTTEANGNVVSIEVFGESLCPDTTRFLRQNLLPLWKNFGHSGRLNISYHPFGIMRSGGCKPVGTNDFQCSCQHGEKECLLNTLQACIIRELSDANEYLETVVCIQQKFELYNALYQCVEKATFNSKPILDAKKMSACANSADGRRLLKQHETAQKTLAPTLHWVPWVLINGVRNKNAEQGLWTELCNGYLKPRPEECNRALN